MTKTKHRDSIKFRDLGGKVHEVELPEDPEKRAQFTPYILVDETTQLPVIDSLSTAAAKNIVAWMQGKENYKGAAEQMDIDEESVKKILARGLDPERQWRGRCPVTVGGVIEPTDEDDVRLVAAHVSNHDCAPVWVPDMSQGEHLYRKCVAAVEPNDTRVKYWKENYKNNKPHFKHGVNELQGAWKDKPVILAGSSPSLQKNWDVLKEAGKHKDVKVVGCNRLMKHIDPSLIDYMVSLDFMGRRDWFEGFDCNKTRLIAWLCSSSMVNEYWRDDRIYWYISHLIQTELDFETDHMDMGTVVNGASVSTAMIWFAFHILQANPIILCGFDHAYPNMEVYPGEKMKYSSHISDLQFTNSAWDDEVIPTSRMLMNQRVQNDMAILWCRKAGRRIINSTEGGILRCTDQMPLAEAYKRFVLKKEDPNDEVFQELRRRTLLHMNSKYNPFEDK